jgi:hypothetical protein
LRTRASGQIEQNSIRATKVNAHDVRVGGGSVVKGGRGEEVSGGVGGEGGEVSGVDDEVMR